MSKPTDARSATDDAQTEATANSTADPEDDLAMDEDSDATGAPTPEKQKKEKRDKPKKKKQAEEETEAPADSGRKSSRHAAIMAKKDKALKAAPEPDTGDAMDVDKDEDEAEDLEMHGLEPLPQPEPVALDTSKPTYETLPSWLSAPIRVGPDTRTPFTELGISARAAKALEGKGFKDAFAVQTAAVPLLLPSCKQIGRASCRERVL